VAEEQYDAEIYRYKVPPTLAPETSHVKVVDRVGSGKRVLELGSAVGDMTRRLRARGCDVVAVEIDANGVAETSRWADRVVIADLNLDGALNTLEGHQFDVVVAADVLEHLTKPEYVLTAIPRLLLPGGRLVVSVPNIAHGDVRLALLDGAFSYTDTGLLDRTHVRFFTLAGVQTLLEATGYTIMSVDRVTRDLGATEVSYDRRVATPEVLAIVNADQESRTYQFVITAEPIGPTAGARKTPSSGSNDLESSLSQTIRRLQDRVMELETAAEERREVQIEKVAAAEAERDRLRAVVDSIHRSRTWRVATALGSGWRRLCNIMFQTHRTKRP